ncbi:hypothetical protein [Croceitalea rosinachiae]|uniref:Right handed beta helix region n=1 Tax=Croceitalea rosinachiae TaxID=3075596 RepID=A0ABU3AEJ8_9FLAO|nr:hypothetical protein [Croceitalea sp. F388]MDT0607306.1 hypothetical protein [Croceitalea sp. F388]
MKASLKIYILFALVLFFIGLASCRKDFDFKTSSGNLEFSKDTVFLDTIFTNIGSSTYTLKVYNRENKDVVIPFIGLKNGQQSKYRLNVDGLAGKEFNDVPILAKDSMFIFIETTFDIAETGQNEFLHTDAIQFENTGTTKTVELVTLVKDAIFLYPERLENGFKETLLLGLDEDQNEIRIEGFFLDGGELNFNNQKPYVIYGYAAVPEGETLTMQAGTRVHFHKDSGILVSPNAAIEINGALSEDQMQLENEVIFEGDRLEPEFADTPGQWGTIWITAGSVNNQIEHLTLKNATVGILVEGDENNTASTLSINNSQLYNSTTTNLWSRTANISAENTVFGNSGSISLYCNLGGNYNFKHCTIANYWVNGFRNAPALYIDNYITLADGSSTGADLESASFANCIIDGNRNIELLLSSNTTNTFQFNFLNCSIQFDDINGDFAENPLFDFSDIAFFETIFLNQNTDFEDPRNNLFKIQANAEILDLGDLNTALNVPDDILGNLRTTLPDIGAYEFIVEQ